MINRPLTNAEWQARDDANGLAHAEEIKNDPARYQRAQQAMNKMVEEKEDEIRGMKKAAGKPSRTPVDIDKSGIIGAKAVEKTRKKVTNGHNVFQRI